MKNKSKKLISLVLVIAMALSIMPAITLAAHAAEIERPQGISIVQDFDTYEKRVTEDGNPQWLESLGLPATVKVGGEEKAVTWADFKTYVDMSTPGYYALPGTVEGVAEQTYIVIQVREKINLMAGFEGDFEGSRNYWYLEGVSWANHSFVQDPVQHGDYALKAVYTGTKTNMSFAFLKYTGDYASAPADLADLITGGTYYFGIYGRVGSTASETNRWLGAKLQYSTNAATAVGSGNNLQYHIQMLDSESWKSSYLIAELPADTAWVWPYITYSTEGGDANGDEIYLDNAELVNIDVLPLENEPATMTEVTGDAFAPIAIAKDYDKYVADWQAALALPTTVTVAGSDGTTDTANVIWDYSALDLTKPGKYVLTGKLASPTYLNVSGLTAQQVILVSESANLLFNGDFTDGSTGRTGWSGDWLCAKAAHPTDADRTVLNAYRTDAKRWYTQVLAQQTNAYKTELAAKVKEGQYYFAIDIMSVDYDETNAAREDLMAELNFLADGAELTTNVNTAVKVNEWTTVSEVINTTGTYASVTTQLQVKAVTNNVPTSLYLTNFKLILLKAVLSSECTEHTYTDYVTAPTCEDAGYTEHICFVCGYSYTDNEVAALGHTAGEAVIENEKAPTCVAAGSYDSVVYCTVCDAKISSTTMTGEAATGEHNYVDGVCDVCGAEEVTGPAVDENLKFNAAPGLSFKDYIGMQILVTSAVAQNYDRVWIEAVQADPAGDVTTILEGVSYYYGIYLKFEQQVLSWSMAENITLTLWAEKDGETVKGETFSGSVEDLALEKIASYAAANNTAAVTALVDMLNYGAAVQTSFNHNADMLPNTKLGDYTGTTATPEFNATNSITGTGSLTVASNSISMQAKVEIQLLIMGKIDGYTVSAKVGGADAPVVVDTEKYAGYGWTLVKVAVAADKMREVYTISVNDANGTPVTPVYNVSVEAYGKTQLEGAKADVVIAMMRYGDSVAAL